MLSGVRLTLSFSKCCGKKYKNTVSGLASEKTEYHVL